MEGMGKQQGLVFLAHWGNIGAVRRSKRGVIRCCESWLGGAAKRLNMNNRRWSERSERNRRITSKQHRPRRGRTKHGLPHCSPPSGTRILYSLSRGFRRYAAPPTVIHIEPLRGSKPMQLSQQRTTPEQMRTLFLMLKRRGAGAG